MQLFEVQMFPLQSASEVHAPVGPPVVSTQTGVPEPARVTQLHVALPGHAGALVQMSPPDVHTEGGTHVPHTPELQH